MKTIGIDVGGTFTDFVLFDSDAGEVSVLKLSSGGDTSATMVEGIGELCRQAGVEPRDLGLVIHGTTVATNAILEYKGAKTGMITTEGFRDVTHIGRHQRPQNYSIQQDIPWQDKPLVKRRFRKPVPERLVPPTGEVLKPLDEEAVRAAARELAAEGVEAVSICFLFSYLNDAHERRAAEIVAEEMPDAFVCTSSEIVPQFREFERFTTTAVNAFVGPEVEHYIDRLDKRVKESGVTAPLNIMQSNGGTATPQVAARKPVTLLLSGPVGGVMGGIWSARGKQRYLATLDVGGTSADIGIVTEDGLVEARARDTWVGGYPVTVPIIDIETIGAGGGSVAYIDKAGALHVGPRSAGAQPGPAAYGRGGTEPTLTDANVVLGRLPGTLAGQLELDREAAEAAVASVGERLGMSVLETATGIVRIVNENMAAALRMKTIQRGLDPRQFMLAAFGGAGPLQAAELARILEIPEVLIPPNPGVTSAAGLLTSDLRYDVSQSFLRPLSRIDRGQLEAAFREQEAQLGEQLRADGCAEEDISVEWAADLRYHGQSYELKVALPGKEVTEAGIAALSEAFHRDHEQEFGHKFPEFEIELVNARLTGIGALPHLRHTEVAGGSRDDAHVGDVEVGFAVEGGNERLSTPVYERDVFP
ncbi:MAG TPA: hydantoinase/oxoprolinase family protein, partial [Solirubrobacterales bacterium]|nr:hydantoinase/oxoprolinase family protein [Solirubrobacterales bacterium]